LILAALIFKQWWRPILVLFTVLIIYNATHVILLTNPTQQPFMLSFDLSVSFMLLATMILACIQHYQREKKLIKSDELPKIEQSISE
jgi:hypothetical protein